MRCSSRCLRSPRRLPSAATTTRCVVPTGSRSGAITSAEAASFPTPWRRVLRALAPRLGSDARVEAWRTERDLIRTAVLDRAWNDDLAAYAGAFGSDRLDAAVLLMPLYGFLPMHDERMRSTVEVVARRLCESGRVRRWSGAEEGGFAVCSFWLAECFALGGEVDRARQVFEAASGAANDVGLLSELIDDRGELAGNMPQAFVHAGLISAAAAIDRASAGERRPMTAQGSPSP